MYKICIDTTVFKNYQKFPNLLIKFLEDLKSLNYAYEDEKHLIENIFYKFLQFISEDDLSLDKFLELKNKYPNLHDGEICLIGYSIENNCCFLSDDDKARSKAKKENVFPCCLRDYEIGGSIGILLFLRDIIDFVPFEESKQIYENMKNHNWLPNIDIYEIKLKECSKSKF